MSWKHGNQNIDKNICYNIMSFLYADIGREYYEMLVLPGSRPNIACLTMTPYIDEKAMKKFSEKGGVDLKGAVPQIFIKDGNDLGIVVTADFVAFKFKYEKDNNFWVKGSIPVSNIKSMAVEIGETSSTIMINGVKLIEVKIKGSYKQDFTIDRQKVNDQIRAKMASAQPVQSAPAQPVQSAPAQPDVLEQLEKLSKLKEAGILSEEEFASKKADLLSKL